MMICVKLMLFESNLEKKEDLYPANLGGVNKSVYDQILNLVELTRSQSEFMLCLS